MITVCDACILHAHEEFGKVGQIELCGECLKVAYLEYMRVVKKARRGTLGVYDG